MKQLTVLIFAVIGVVLMVIVVFSIYILATDSHGIRPALFSISEPAETDRRETSGAGENAESEERGPRDGFELTDNQIGALVSLGVSPDDVPARISAEQEVCLVSELGEARVAEIKSGVIPSALEFMRVESCV